MKIAELQRKLMDEIANEATHREALRCELKDMTKTLGAAGIAAGHVITHVNNEPVRHPSDVAKILAGSAEMGEKTVHFCVSQSRLTAGRSTWATGATTRFA